MGYNVGGTVRTFLRSSEGSPWREQFAGLTPGTASFSAAWMRAARLQGREFGDAQHAFIRRTHYDPAVNGVAQLTRLDLNSRSDAIRNVAWSVAVQHAGAIEILKDAVNRTDRSLERNNTNYERQLINNIYDIRITYVINKVSPRSTARTVVSGRYVRERNDALKMLDGIYRTR